MKNEWKQWIRRRLIGLREEKGWILKYVANRIGLKPKTYYAYEEGRAEPSLPTIMLLCQLYEITKDQFFEGNPQESPKNLDSTFTT